MRQVSPSAPQAIISLLKVTQPSGGIHQGAPGEDAFGAGSTKAATCDTGNSCSGAARLVSVAFSALLIQFHLNALELNEKIACGGRPVGFATASVSLEATPPRPPCTLSPALWQVLDCWQPIWRAVLKCLCCCCCWCCHGACG